MKHRDHDTFLTCLHACLLVEARFTKKGSGETVVRQCVPLDYGPFGTDRMIKYHLFNLAPSKHTMGIESADIRSIVATKTTFVPEEIVTWAPHWHVARSW